MSEDSSSTNQTTSTSNSANIFANIKYKITGNVSEEVINILKEGGAEGSNYFSDHLTHCIVGDDPFDTDIADAKDLYEIPAVIVDWVLLSKKCGKLLPIKPFIAAENMLFTGVSVCISQVSKEDSSMLWAMITFYGGTFSLNLNSKTTHLIAGKAEGTKYNHLMTQENCSIHIVTPDWVTTCIVQKTKVDESTFHPRLIVIPRIERKVSELSSSFSTAHITGFADDEAVPKEEQSTPKLSNELLEQLKQRMPWNQQSTANSTSIPPTSQNFTISTMSGGMEIKEEIKLPVTPTAMQQSVQSMSQNLIQLKPPAVIQHATIQQKTQIILQQQQQQQRLQQPLQGTPQWRTQPPLQQTQQQLIHQQLQAHQQQQQQALGQQTMLLSPQNQHEGQQFITSQTQQLINRTQQIVHPQQKPVQQQQFIVRETPPHLVQSQYENKPQAQFTWQQQPQYAQNRQQIINPQAQPRQITWMQQPQAQGATRQFIQMDAQTHAQLQQMDPQQRAIFLQRIQKQRQLVLQRQLQAQQQNRGVLEQNQIQFGVRANQPQGAQPQPQAAVIRGQIPPGLNPQHQIQWLQQQRHNQIVIQQNSRPVLVQQQPQPTAGIIRAPLQTVQHQRLPVNVVSQPTQQQQWQQENNIQAVTQQPVTPTQQQQQQQLLNMRQQQLQIQRIQQLQLQKQHQAPAAGPRMPLYSTQATIPPPPAPTPQPSVLIPQHQETPDSGSNELFGVNGQQQTQQGLVVNAKTKTALANMLSIRLQTGSTSTDGSAAGQLRMMTAQHQAPLPPPPPPQVAQLPFQRTTLGNVNNNIGLRSSEIVPSPGITKPAAFAQTALRVAAVLQKSASGTPPTNHHHRPQFYGHSPNLKLPPDMFLLGCVFLIMEYDRSGFDVTMWRRIILENGGETELTYSLRVTHILCQTQKHPLVQQGIRDGKRCVTAEWLSDIMIKQQVLPPWLALHFPTPFSDEKPCRNLIISHSGFEGEERTRVKKMIEAVGAKMTSYYTSHNNILVCRRPEGEKYKKAREWGRSVVNVQWLNEVLFGHYSCLQHPENPKYQQFNIGNPFRIDYTLVPHLMGAWKVPIQVTQECYDRAKASGIVGPKRKRPRVASPTNMGGIEQENMFPIESTLPPIGMPKAIVLFSGPTTTPADGEKKVLHLGGVLAKNCREATHLVVYKLQRTLKFMCALSVCRYIVNINWLNDSFNSSQFLDEQPYMVDDPEFEKKHNCNIMKILSNPDRSRLFAGKVFYITPGVIPSRSALTEMVICAGGIVEKQRKSLKQIQELDSNSYIIITVSNDFHLVSDVIRANIGIYGAEFIMSAILTQRLPYETAFRRNNMKKSL